MLTKCFVRLGFMVLAMVCQVGGGVAAHAETIPDRHMRPLTLRLPEFYLERMVQEPHVFTHQNWLGLGQEAAISTLVCSAVSEVLQPLQAPLRSALIRQDGAEDYTAQLRHKFSIGQTCGSTVEFELKMNVTWKPEQQLVVVRATGTDHDGNFSGSADWEFKIPQANPASIEIVIPQDSFQSGLMYELSGPPGACNPSPGACAGMRVTSFATR